MLHSGAATSKFIFAAELTLINDFKLDGLGENKSYKCLKSSNCG